jgi:hypothetical protein
VASQIALGLRAWWVVVGNPYTVHGRRAVYIGLGALVLIIIIIILVT